MQFVVIGRDGADEGALERRLAHREAHLEMARKMYEDGAWLYAAALLDDAGKMNGSVIVCEFESPGEMQEQWLDHEPYLLGGVWEDVEIRRGQTAPFWAKS